jgi:hypothetical protein
MGERRYDSSESLYTTKLSSVIKDFKSLGHSRDVVVYKVEECKVLKDGKRAEGPGHVAQRRHPCFESTTMTSTT